LSNAQIAKQTGRDDKTVAKFRRDLESNSEIPNKTDRTEKSGRKARGRKPGARVKRHTDQQGKNPLANGPSRATTPLQWVAADCKDESGLQWHEAKLPGHHRYAVIPCAADRYDVMFDRTYLSFHAPTAEVGKAIAEAHYAGRGLESAVPPQATEPVPVETTTNIASNKNFEDDTFEPDENVEDPKKVLENVLDSIKQSKAVAEAYRKVLKVSPFDRAAKKQISDEIELLIRKWRSVQSVLVQGT
jgi:hypothetical protein